MARPPKEKYKPNFGGRRDFENSPAKVRDRNRAAGHLSTGEKLRRAYNNISLPKRPFDRMMDARNNNFEGVFKKAIKTGKKLQQGEATPRRSGGSLLQIREGTRRKNPKTPKNPSVRPLQRPEHKPR